ncbi:MAG: N-acetyltransferase [Arenicellales bacterium]
MRIIRATEQHVDAVAHLFDLYRQFYECEPDLGLAREFIGARIEGAESIIFVAEKNDQQLQGFVQLYPSFCSVEAIKIQILYDLYVEAESRKQGVAEALMRRASAYAKETGAARVDLLTAKTNQAGQHLYEKLGYKIVNQDFHAYSLYP